jgi:hypothetical protein
MMATILVLTYNPVPVESSPAPGIRSCRKYFEEDFQRKIGQDFG